MWSGVLKLYAFPPKASALQVAATAGALQLRPATTQAMRLIGADMVIANHLAPAFEVARHDLVEAGVREAGRLEAEVPQPRRNFRRKHCLADIERDLLEERFRSRGGREDAVPGFDAYAREHAVERRHLGQRLDRSCAGHEERTQGACTDLRQHADRDLEHEVHFAG